MHNQQLIKLTNRELEVMQIFWESLEPMTATDVIEILTTKNSSNKNNVYTVQNLLKSLLDKGALQVASYSKVGKSNAREYVAAFTNDEYAVMQFNHYFSGKDKNPILSLVASFLNNGGEEIETIEALEKLLDEKKSDLNK